MGAKCAFHACPSCPYSQVFPSEASGSALAVTQLFMTLTNTNGILAYEGKLKLVLILIS